MTEPKRATEKAAKKPVEPAEPEALTDDLDHPYDEPYDAERYPFVLTLATGELVGSPSSQTTHHWSRDLEADVPVIGVMAR